MIIISEIIIKNLKIFIAEEAQMFFPFALEIPSNCLILQHHVEEQNFVFRF